MRRPRRLVAVLLGGVLALVLVEIGLRAFSYEANAYFVWWPRLQKTFHPLPGVMPGVEGVSEFRATSIGLRGDEQSPEDGFRILALGGSTTECLFLDQTEAWPQVLQEELNERQSTLRVWCGNGGRSGLSTRDHVVQLERLLPQLEELDLALLLVGVNDVFVRLRQDEDYDPDYIRSPEDELEYVRRGFQVRPLGIERRGPPWKWTALWRFASLVRDRFSTSGRTQDEAGEIYVRWREHRRTASAMRETLPDLTTALGEYTANIEAMIRVCRERGVRPLLLTQPTMWRDDLPDELRELLWMGGVGDFMEQSGCEYYTVEALTDAMRQYNEVLARVAAEQGVLFLDLASEIPKDLSCLYDDCHFNEEGSRRVADLLAEYILAHEPFTP